jgi:hypothetical protein
MGCGHGGEMTQALYAHMNNKTIKIIIKRKKNNTTKRLSHTQKRMSFIVFLSIYHHFQFAVNNISLMVF